jgi:DNA-binding transcriptional regulator YiaG
LSRDGLFKNKKVHRLVAQTFIPNIKNLPQVNHGDGNKQNNFVDNLEWCTNEENQLHAIEYLGVNKNKARGEKHGSNKLKEYQIIEIKELLKEGKLTQQRIANLYNVSRRTIGYIKSGKIWSYITID